MYNHSLITAHFLLTPTDGPTCKRSTPLVLGVPRHHSLNVTCQVSSFPPPSGFSWSLRTYLGRLQVPQDRINWQGTTSWITYTPRATDDYGELTCWAHTRKGHRQQVPCVARLVPADTPDAPERCRVSRRTPSSLTVSCIAAHDGGLPQTFHAWVSAGWVCWVVGGGRSHPFMLHSC